MKTQARNYPMNTVSQYLLSSVIINFIAGTKIRIDCNLLYLMRQLFLPSLF